MNTQQPSVLKTSRLLLRCWHNSDRIAFAEMNSHPEVMHDLGGPMDRETSDRKFDRYAAVFKQYGFGRWVIENHEGVFLGYAVIMPVDEDHVLGQHYEIGWRLNRDAWGKGYATEAASAALIDFFNRVKVEEVLSYTAPDNLRSQAVMTRLGLTRDAERDFEAHYDGYGKWRGLVWVAQVQS